MKNPEQFVIRNADGKVLGRIKGNIYFKTIKKSKHFVRKFGGGIAIDTEILNQLAVRNIEFIQVKETENKITYTVSLEKYLEKARQIDLGYGEQKLLAIHHWKAQEA